MNQRLLILALILITSVPTWAQKKKKPLYKAQIGVAAYTLRKSFPHGVAGTLDTVKMMGFTEIEGGGGARTPAEEFKKMCDERGISIPSTGAPYESFVKEPAAVAERAKILGAKYIMCSWIPHDRGNFTLENAKQAVQDFNAAGKILKENGITFCYHAHGYEFQPYENGTLLDYIITNTNPEYVSFEMDVFWIQFGGGDPVGLLKKYGDRWKLVHLKDMKKGTPKDLTGLTSGNNNVPLGQGEIDIAGVIREGNKIGIKHFFIEDESDDMKSQVAQSIAYLKSLTE